jgi:hypothetical protein
MKNRTENILGHYARNVGIINAQANGLTHAQSLLQPPMRGNCMNWVIGHIVRSRLNVIGAAGGPVPPGNNFARYERGNQPILADGPDVIPLPEQLARLGETQAALAAWLGGMAEADLDVELDWAGNRVSREYLLRFFHFHDTYHTGNLELLRQLAGVNDQVI